VAIAFTKNLDLSDLELKLLKQH